MLEGYPLTMDVRRSGNYKPSICEDGYVQSRANLYAEEKYCEEAGKLKEEVRRMLEKPMTNSLEQLELIDILQRLGIDYHLEEEIDRVLKQIYVNYNKRDHHNGLKNEELYATALEFRLLRQQGYHVPQEIFCSFMNEGKFKTTLVEDTQVLLSMYEASYLSMEGDNIMEKARDFATHYLMESLEKKKMDENLAEQVSHALEMPLHWRMERLEARWFIEVYHKKENMNPLLLELAKLDYNMVQATYLEELKQMSRWDKNIKLVKKMSFVRDRLVEGFFWAVGFTPNPQFGYCRKLSTKLSVLLTTIDDIYDVYGSLDELELFTDIVDRWDINAIEQLPDYMKICFLALFNSMNELAYDILKEQGFSIISHIRKEWANLCKAYLLEVKWYQRGDTPSLNEFLRNAWITNTGPVLIMHAYFCITNPIKEEELECLKNYPSIIYSPSLILRLVNDLATSPDEIKKGDYLKSIQCYMHESGSCEENARNYIKNLIDQTWKKMNRDILRDRSFSKDFRRTTMNLARIAQCMYQHGDGFGIPDRETKDRILSLFFEPIPLS
ncbi:Trans-alpha-bergamotene synthase [Capsicum baccatum]|uniref:Trans-alpha-bergamotene synthase n=1 Tax=Capsicum baccatum TaxID=33114 RepID=A0A2G2VAK6_CAPBA|nr:Trans-alpha-bergamotene synthase [Capsicum baccatum]